MSEGGSVSVLSAALTAVTILLGVGAMDGYTVLASLERARTAAEAGALAAAPAGFVRRLGDPHLAAGETVANNGARLARCVCPVDRSPRRRRAEVTAEVTVDLLLFGRQQVRATASAVFDPVLARPNEVDAVTG